MYNLAIEVSASNQTEICYFATMNYAETLKKAFDSEFNAPIEVWEHFASLCDRIDVKKDEVLKKAFHSERYFYFIIKGSVGLFLWKENNFVCLDFAFDHQFCADYMSLITHQETPLELVALENCQLLRITADNYHKLTQLKFGGIIRLLTAESSFVDKQLQQIELLTKNASERYSILHAKFPEISQRIAQQHIASYLGITPQSLSRIKKSLD